MVATPGVWCDKKGAQGDLFLDVGAGLLECTQFVKMYGAMHL